MEPSCDQEAQVFGAWVLPEEVAIERAKGGDRHAVDHLYRTYADMMRATVFRFTGSEMDADDAVHDIFVTLPARLRTYEGRGSFKAWLRKASVRQALMILRQRKVRGERGLPEDLFGRGDLEASAAALIDLDRVLWKLPDESRIVLLLFTAEGYSHKEIGEVLGISEGYSAVCLHRARKLVRKFLSDPV